MPRIRCLTIAMPLVALLLPVDMSDGQVTRGRETYRMLVNHGAGWSDAGGFRTLEDCNREAALYAKKYSASAGCAATSALERQRAELQLQQQQRLAQCDRRARVWLSTLPRHSKIAKYDMAKAIGPDCDVNALLDRHLKNLEANRAIVDECLKRWKAGGEAGWCLGSSCGKRFDLNDPSVMQELWLDIARTAGNECADLLAR